MTDQTAFITARRAALAGLALAGLAWSCASPPAFDTVIRNGTIYDGTGAPGRHGDIAIKGDRLAVVGVVGAGRGAVEVDAQGLAVAPGFINMLSHSERSLLADGHSQGEILQGVTLEVLGEGSMGPLSDAMKKDERERQADIKFDVNWTTLGEYLDRLTARGVSPNIASFVGASTVREHELGMANRAPSAEELERMRHHVRLAMEEGAMGLASALIYAPGNFARTDELIELAKVAAQYQGMYMSHMRSEGNRFLEAIDELLTIARKSGIRSEIYHLKAAGQGNWGKLDAAVRKIEAAREEGLEITADMYTYTSGSTGLNGAMPPWVQEGGYQAWAKRLQDPAVRTQLRKAMTETTDEWENLLFAAGGDGTLLVGFKNEALREYQGKTLAEVAKLRDRSIPDTAMDLVIEDGSRVQVVYSLMSEDNVRRQIRLPWVSFGSDGASMATAGVFTRTSTHPRAYGNFARLLGRYVRDEHLIPIEEAVRRLTAFPAATLRIKERGLLQPGMFADIAVFDPRTIADRATYENPHVYSTGMRHVWVNGVAVVREGQHTGATPGRVIRGPGWKPHSVQHEVYRFLPEVKAALQRILTADLDPAPADLFSDLPEHVPLPHPAFEALRGPSLYDRWLESSAAASRTGGL